MPATITRKLVSINDAADALAVSTRTVRRYIAEGQLDAVRLGRQTIRIKVDSSDRFIDARPVAMTATRGQTGFSLFPVCSPNRKEPLERGSDLVVLCGRYWD